MRCENRIFVVRLEHVENERRNQKMIYLTIFDGQ